MERKLIIITIIVVAIVVGVYAYWTTRPAAFRIGYQPSIHQIAHMTAMEKGWWKENLAKFGIEKVTDYEFASGPPEMQAMIAGDLDIAYVGATPPITAIYQGLDAKIVAGAQIQGSALALGSGIEYTGPDDLRGLKIATFPLGSIQDTVLRKWLGDAGLNVPYEGESDVEIVAMGTGEAISAIRAGAVDGVFLPHPGPAIVELEGSGRIVENSGGMWENHACCVLVVSGKLIRENPEMVKEIIRIHIVATEYNKAHVDEAAEIYASKIGWPVENVRYSLGVWDGYWVHDPHIGMDCTLEYARVIYELGGYDRVLTQEDLFDTSFYDNIAETSWYQNIVGST